MTRNERIVQRVAAGESITQVATDEGISRQRVSQIIHKHGLYFELPRQVSRGRAMRQSMAVLARSGVDIDQIAAWFGRSHDQTRTSLREAGIEFIRPQRVPRHGTATEYKHYRCRCEPCRAANAAQCRAWMNGAGKAATLARARAYRKNRPEAQRAWKAVGAAIRAGELRAPARCACGRDARVHAHHDDYSRPLDVLWLCAVCHKARHQKMRQQKAA